MQDPRPDQIQRAVRLISEFGTKLTANPDGVLELCEVMAGLIGTNSQPGPKSKNSVSDPTGRAALTTDEVRKDLNAVYKAVDQIVGSVLLISQNWTDYMPSRIEAQRRAKAIANLSADDDTCPVHMKAGIYEARGSRFKGVCDFCGNWRSAHDGVDPVPELLRARDRGERITSKLIQKYQPEAIKAS